MINTVCGKIYKEELSKVYMHEHVYADLSSVRKEEDSILTDINEIIREYKYCVDTGINTVVDVSCIGMGRDVKRLREVSKSLGINIIASTGFYLTSYYPEYVYEKSAEELADIFIKEINVGVDDTGVRCGIIGEIATAKNEFTDINKKVFKAACLAYQNTGATITTHASAGTMAVEQATFLLENGVPKHKIIIGHMDLQKDINKIIDVLKLGVNIGIDTIGKNNYLDESTRLQNLYDLIKLGYINQIVLSQDISRKSYYKSRGGLGYDYLPKIFIPKLLEKGITEKEVEIMLIDNPKNILDIDERQLKLDSASHRVKILLSALAISEDSVVLCHDFISLISEKHVIDKKHDNYNMFETHLVMALERILKGEKHDDFPAELEDEIKDNWQTELTKNTLKSICNLNNLIYSEAEAKFLALHVSVLVQEEI